MSASAPYPPLLFKVFAGVFLGAAIFHGLGWIEPSWVAPEPRWRHGCYFVLDLVNAYFMPRRPTWQVALLWLIMVEQMLSHGASAYAAFVDEGRLDGQSIGVVIVMLAIVLTTTHDWARRFRARPRAA